MRLAAVALLAGGLAWSAQLVLASEAGPSPVRVNASIAAATSTGPSTTPPASSTSTTTASTSSATTQPPVTTATTTLHAASSSTRHAPAAPGISTHSADSSSQASSFGSAGGGATPWPAPTQGAGDPQADPGTALTSASSSFAVYVAAVSILLAGAGIASLTAMWLRRPKRNAD